MPRQTALPASFVASADSMNQRSRLRAITPAACDKIVRPGSDAISVRDINGSRQGAAAFNLVGERIYDEVVVLKECRFGVLPESDVAESFLVRGEPSR